MEPAPQPLTGRAAKVVLRLDDGSLLGEAKCLLGAEGEKDAGKAVLVPPEKAVALGKTNEQQLQAMIKRLAMAERLEEYRRENILDAVIPVRELPPQATAVPGTDPAAATPSANIPGDWKEQCRQIRQQVFDSLAMIPGIGDHRSTFGVPVDPKIVPKYYDKIKEPMDLGTMLEKLNNNKYPGPEEFLEDMKRVWNNAKRFNDQKSMFYKAAVHGQKTFESLWARSGLATAVRPARRRAAPSVIIADDTPASRPRSARAAGKRRRDNDEDYSGGTGGHTPSGRAPRSAGRNAGAPEMDQATIAKLWEKVGAYLSSDDPNTVAPLAQILTDAGCVKLDDQGEQEVDPALASNETLWQLYNAVGGG
ncbi:unnamed protein product [Pedinophyceae sp. YPF-701]|nr:unnamed protein product [Pedinophyceae sp. YPF-701]